MRPGLLKIGVGAGVAAGLLGAVAVAQNTVSTPAAVSPLPSSAATPTTPAMTAATSPTASTAPVVVTTPSDEVVTRVAPPAIKSAAAANTTDDDDLPAPPPPPLKRPRFTAAVLQATDKITAETLRFEAKVGESVRYKGLIVTLRACETNAPDEDIADSVANVEVISQPQGVAGGHPAPTRQVFRGWMYASSPSIHPLEHPLYDLWVIACRTNAPVTPPAPVATPAPTPRKPVAPKPDVDVSGNTTASNA